MAMPETANPLNFNYSNNDHQVIRYQKSDGSNSLVERNINNEHKQEQQPPKKKKGTSLREIYPQLTRTWHAKKNEKTTKEVKAASSLVYWWKCPKGPDHEWPETIKSRLSKGVEWCPCCLNFQVSKTNSLAGIAPHIAAQWHHRLNSGLDINPESVLATSTMSMWWQCPIAKDHVWQSSVALRVERFKELNDKLIMTSSSSSSKMTISSRNEEDVNMKQEKYHDHQSYENDSSMTGEPSSSSSSISNKIKIDDCPCCQGLKVSITNCLSTMKPEIAELWHPNKNMVDGIKLQPDQVLSNSNGTCWLKCHPTNKKYHAVQFQSLSNVILNRPLTTIAPSSSLSSSLSSSSSSSSHLSPFRCIKCTEIAVRDVMDLVLLNVNNQISEIEINKELKKSKKSRAKPPSATALLSLSRLKAKTQTTINSQPTSTSTSTMMSLSPSFQQGDLTMMDNLSSITSSTDVPKQEETVMSEGEGNPKKSSTCIIA